MSMPKEPRQQMINMMYLVLTAMLALNITKEVLNAFGTINSSIERSNGSISAKNAEIYKNLEDQAQNPNEAHKVKPYLALAEKVKTETNQTVAYLEQWKDSVIALSGGKILNPTSGDSVISNIENIDASPQLFVKQGNGDKIKEKLQAYINNILAIVPAEAKENIGKNFPVQVVQPPKSDDNPSQDWTFGTFNNIPVVAAVAVLSKFQNDIKNAESMVLEDLKSRIHLEDYKFDKLEPIAVPNTSYALAGQDIEATILLAAYNSQVNPAISSSAGAVKVENGVGKLKFKASGVGLQTVRGAISTNKNGKEEKYEYKFEYMVGTAGASMQLDYMNVMYIGVDNPVTLSASGYNIEDVDLVVPGDVTRKAVGKGKFNLAVTKPGPFKYSITAKDRSGARVNVGGGEIRVKRIPDPVATLAGKTGGPMPSNQIGVQMGLSASIAGFEYPVTFKVTKFSYIVVRKGQDPAVGSNTGAIFNGELKNILKTLRPGDQVIFSEVKAIGPDNTTRSIPSLVFNII